MIKKVLVHRLKELFHPKNFQEINITEVYDALGDPSVRKHFIYEVLQEIIRINRSIDTKLVSGIDLEVREVSARRRALQFVLDTALSAKREVQRSRGHNPSMGKFDLEDATV